MLTVVAAKKKETDWAALQSPFMKIPQMRVEIARDLLDLGLREVYDLQGRCPEMLFESLKAKGKPNTDDLTRAYLRMAVYYAENGSEADPRRLQPGAWMSA